MGFCKSYNNRVALLDWMIEWLNDWMIEWLNDWMIEWLNAISTPFWQKDDMQYCI